MWSLVKHGFNSITSKRIDRGVLDVLPGDMN